MAVCSESVSQEFGNFMSFTEYIFRCVCVQVYVCLLMNTFLGVFSCIHVSDGEGMGVVSI